MADMKGMIALVTGGRVKIGYQCTLRLLRCGAEVWGDFLIWKEICDFLNLIHIFHFVIIKGNLYVTLSPRCGDEIFEGEGFPNLERSTPSYRIGLPTSCGV